MAHRTHDRSPAPRTWSVLVACVLSLPGVARSQVNLSPSNQNFQANGGTQTVQVINPTPPGWTVTKSDQIAWVTITSSTSGSGNGSFTYSVEANPAAIDREAIVTVTTSGGGSQIHQIRQLKGQLNISPSSANVDATGGSGRIDVNMQQSPGLQWTAASNSSWLSITSGSSGVGTGAVQWIAETNPTGESRATTITVTPLNGVGQTFHVNQQPGSASPRISANPSSVNPSAAGATGSLQVSATPGSLSWTATSNANWLRITSGASATGNGAISFTADANPSANSRAANITVAGQGSSVVVPFSQPGGQLSISPSSANVAAAGGTNTITISTSDLALQWTATLSSTAAWVTLTSATGTGPGTVTWTVAANTEPSGRSATILVTPSGGTPQSFSLNQDAGEQPGVITLNPSRATAPASTSTGIFEVATSSSILSWRAESDQTWLTIGPTSGTGNRSVQYFVAGTPLGAPRTANITITPTSGTPAVFVLTQTGGVLTIDPSSTSANASGASGRFAITTNNSTLRWRASSNTDWLTITSSSSGSGDQILQWSAAGNSGSSTRSAKIAVIPDGGGSSLDFTVTQNHLSGTITAIPGSLAFSYQQRGSLPAEAQITIRSDADSLPLVIAATTTQGNWLTVNGSGPTPSVLTVTANPTGLSPGVYTGTITITSPSATNSPLLVPVSFTVTPSPILSAEPNALSFAFQQNGIVPAEQNLNLNTSSGELNYTILPDRDAPWLLAAGAGPAPASLRVSVNPAGLQPGTYQGYVIVDSPASGNSAFRIPVSFRVSAAPNLLSVPAALSLTYRRLDAIPSPISVRIDSSDATLPFTATSSASWLSVAGGGQTSSSVQVSINPAGLATGSHQGAIVINSAQAANNPLSVPVTLTIQDAPVLTATPATAALAVTQGGPPNASTQIAIGSDSSISFNAQSSSRESWLTVQSSSTQTPAILTVSAQTGSLAPGVYSGTILIGSAAAGNSPLSIPVSLTVSSQPRLTVNPEHLSFAYRIGSGMSPADLHLVVSAPGNAHVPVRVSISSNAASWLSVSGDATTPAAIRATVNPAGLSEGTFSGTLTIESAGYVPLNVPVSLQVTPAPLVTVRPTSLNFSFQRGATPPSPQPIEVTSAARLLFSTSHDVGNSWLSVSGGGQTDSSVSVSVDPSGLQADTYSGAVTIAAPQAGNNPVLIPVTLTVTERPVLTSLPSSLSFTYVQNGAVPPPLAIGIDSAQPVNFTSSVSPPTPWLLISGSTRTPSSLHVSVDPAGLDPGRYSSTILVNAPETANTPLAIPVSIDVHRAPRIVPSPAELNFSYQISGTAPTNQSVVVTGTNPDLIITAFSATSSGGSWLTVAGGGNVPAALSVSVNAAGLQAGTYNGSITIDAAGGAASSVTLPVTLVIAAAPVLTVSPSELTLSYQIGGTAPPVAPILITSSNGALPIETSSSTETGGPWLQVTGGGSTPGTVTTQLNPTGLTPGVYKGSISFAAAAAANSPLVLPVTLNVTTSATLLAAPTSLRFTAQQGSSPAVPQAVQVTSGETAIAVSYSVSPGADWLSVNGGATTPSIVSATVSSVGLAPGRYTAVILARSASVANDPLTIPVTLDVVATPVLSASPAVLRFAYAVSGRKPAPQIVSLSSSGVSIDYEAAVVQGRPWLFSSGSGSTPGSLMVEVDPGALAPGEYAGAISLVPRTGGTPTQVVVTLTVTTDPVLSALPNEIQFSYQLNRDLPPNQTILVVSDRDAVTVSATTQQLRNLDWLRVTGGGSTPAYFTLSVNPSGLPAGTYSSQLLVTAAGSSNSITIPVRLTVSTPPVLTAAPDVITLDTIVGEGSPPNRRITIGTSDGSSVGVSVQPAFDIRWLNATLDRNVTPAVLTVSANPAGLSQGIYYGSVLISSPAVGNSPRIVQVALRIATQPLLTASPASLQFAASSPSGSAPPPATIRVTGGEIPLDFVASVSPATPWLTVSGSGRTPADLIVSANPAGLAAGTYQGWILLTSPTAGFPNVPIPIQLQVTAGAPVIVTSPASLSFTELSTRQQGLQIASSGRPVRFSAGASPSAPWLRAEATGVTPQVIQVAVDGTNLPPGIYRGWIEIRSPDVANSPSSVPVTLTVSRTPALQANPAPLTFLYDSDLPFPQPQAVAVTMGGQPAMASTSSVAPGTPWLSVQSATGGMLNVAVNPSGLLPGRYSGSVLVNSPGASNTPFVVPVNFEVTRVPAADFSRNGVVFVLPASSGISSTTVQIGSGSAMGVQAELNLTASSWLSITPLSGTLPLTVTISANPAGLRPGNYAGSLIVSSSGKQIGLVPIVLTIAEQPGLATAEEYVTFTYYRGGNSPAPIDLQFVRFGAEYLVTATPSEPWLSANPSAPSASGPVQITANPTGLSTGIHTGKITLALADRPGGPPLQQKDIPVEFYIDQPTNPRITTVTNGMSFLPTPLSPGLIFSIFGSGLGPLTTETLQLRTERVGLEERTNTTIARSIGGVQVLINGIQCPVLYASDTQINAIVPYALHGKRTATVAVRYRGVLSHEVLVNVAPAAPGLFSFRVDGSGPGAILNQDQSVNTAANPAAKGTIISLFGGGEGQTNPHGIDGLIATGNVLPVPLLPVSVTIGGIPATDITYAGAAPTLTAGALQVNARIPDNVPSGNIPVMLKIGDAISQPGLTVNVR